MNAGWVAISRKIMNSPDLRTPAERWAMVWMVMEAAWQPTEVACANHKSVVVRRGQFSHSLRHLAREWGMTEPTVRRFLKRLEERRTIRRSADAERDAGQLVVTICNYEQYQSPLREADAAPDALPDAASDAKYNKDNNNKQNTPLTPQGEKRRRRTSGFIEPDLSTTSAFDEFWQVYPRKVGKLAAKELFQRYSAENQRILIEAAKRFAADMAKERRDPTKIPHPKTWLNPERGGFGDYVKGPTNGADRRTGDEQRGADAPRVEDGAAHDDERVLRGGESLRGVCGGDGPVECAGPGGREGGGGLGGLPAPLGEGHAELHHIRAGGVEHPRRDDLDANPLALGDDGHSGGRPAWVH